MLRSLVALAALLALGAAAQAGTYYVAPNGSDVTGNGSSGKPWATLANAVLKIPDDGSTVLVRDGVYSGRVRMSRRFTLAAIFRAENAYRARLEHASKSEAVVTIYGGANMELSGFEITRPSPAATGALLVHAQTAERITIRNNIIHDSYNNDLLKINAGCRNVLVEGNVFYNQSGSDEHIDVNGDLDVTIRDNIFFDDFKGSGRTQGNVASFIVIKNSSDVDVGCKRINVRRNVFLNWEGYFGSNFVLVGEDGKSYYEAEEVLVENNLLIGNSPIRVRAPFGVKGGRLVTFRSNTVVGDMPGFAFGMRLNREGSNPVNDQIHFYNNIWSDPTGTMNNFSDGRPDDSKNVELDNNLYWNGGQPIPTDDDVLNYTMDPRAIVADPRLPAQGEIVLPRWNGTSFLSGNQTIRQEFERLVMRYGVPGPGSAAIGRSDPARTPADDILGRTRKASPDLGAVETTLRPPTVAAAVDAAAYQPRLSPGTLASLFGENLSDVVAAAMQLPLPTELGGVSVLVENQPAPLLYVSPNQINFQLPYEAPLSGSLSAVRQGLSSAAFSYVGALTTPAIFQTGDRTGAVVHASGQLVTAQDPARAGEIVSIYATGLGSVDPPVATGRGATAPTSVLARVDVRFNGQASLPSYAGLAIGFAGLYQVNVQIPSGLRPPVSIELQTGDSTSPAVFLAVRQ